MSVINEIYSMMQKGRSKAVKELIQNALSQGITAEEILNDALLASMDEVGEKFKSGEAYIPEVLVCARAMNAGLEVLKPLLSGEQTKCPGKVCIGTVRGDIHDIGKNLVKIMLEGKGFEVIDLGTNVEPETFVNTAKEEKCDIICLSALLTTTRDEMKIVIDEVKNAGIRDKVKILIGGAPITEEFAKEIGADAYTPDAASAADCALKMCTE
ncbi:MAG TPA: cobalamin-binding protein [Clostridiales bacterium]|mgnify:CR=1 FL=1|nr:cobalamin-binding protein [Clostridiales bacterium]